MDLPRHRSPRDQPSHGKHVCQHPRGPAHSTDFLHREVDLPHHDPLVYALYATSQFEVSTMQSIELIGESKKRFRYFYLVPDSKSLAEE